MRTINTVSNYHDTKSPPPRPGVLPRLIPSPRGNLNGHMPQDPRKAGDDHQEAGEDFQVQEIRGLPMTEDELKAKLAEALYPMIVMATDFEAVPFKEAMERPRHFGLRLSVIKSAEAALTVIADAGCTIVPDDSTNEMVDAGSKKLHHDPGIGDRITADAVYVAMLTASPFKRGKEK